MTENALALRHDDGMPLDKLGSVFVQSGYFKDLKSAQQAVVKVLAGRELGIGAFSAQTALHIIEGKPVLSANLLAAAVKRTGKYTYRIKRLDDTGCSIDFYERVGDKMEMVGTSEFTDKEAAAAGLLSKQNWQKYAKAMYFARAISQGQRWYAPDIFSGVPVYTPDEMELKVNSDGEAIDVHVIEPTMEPVRDEQKADPPATKMSEKLEADAWRKRIKQDMKIWAVPPGELKEYAAVVLGGVKWEDMSLEQAHDMYLHMQVKYGREPGQEG